MKQPARCVENAEGAPAERGSDDPTARLLDVVRIVGNYSRPQHAPVTAVYAQRRALPARHVGAPTAEGDVLRRQVGAEARDQLVGGRVVNAKGASVTGADPHS